MLVYRLGGGLQGYLKNILSFSRNKKFDIIPLLYSQLKTLPNPPQNKERTAWFDTFNLYRMDISWISSYLQDSLEDQPCLRGVCFGTQIAKIRFRYLRENEKYMLSFASLVHPETLNILPFHLVWHRLLYILCPKASIIS